MFDYIQLYMDVLTPVYSYFYCVDVVLDYFLLAVIC